MTTKTRDITFMPSGTLRSRNISGLLAVAVCGLLVALTAPSARACVIAGDCDAFAPPTEPVVLRPIFNAWLNGPTAIPNGTLHGGVSLAFDQVANNWSFGYSFEGLSNFCCPADLTIRMKFGGSNDNLALVFNGTSFAWDATQVFYDPNNGLGGLELAMHPVTGASLCTHNAGTADGAWSFGDDMTCVLDLCALPLGDGGRFNAQADIRAQGALDVYVQDDTAVDCISLCHDTCIKGPAVSAWGLGALALLLLSGVALKFGRRRAAA